MKRLLCLCLILACLDVCAATRFWPGSAPCNGTLQACIDGSSAGDTVLVVTSTPIDETLSITKSMTLRRGPGHLPVLAQNRSINSTAFAPVVTIDGFRLIGGDITIQSDGAARPTIINNRLEGGPNGGGRIQVIKNTVNGSLELEISNNRLFEQQRPEGEPSIKVVSSAVTTGRITFNRVLSVQPLPGRGISVDLSPSHASSMVVFANRIEGAFAQGAIHLTSVQALSTGGTNTINMRALGNVAICPGASGAPGVGIYFAAGFAATYIVNMINNTVVGCSDTGLFVDSIVTGANVSGAVHNNLVAFNAWSVGISGNYVDDFSLTRNLVHGNLFNTLPPSATNTITSNPMLFSQELPRLNAGSPAINAGDALLIQIALSQAGVPQVDADGRRRTIGTGVTAVDIGAYEFGDRQDLVQKTLPAGNNLLGLGFAGEPNLRPQIAKVYNPVATGDTVSNPSPMAVFEFGEWFAYTMNGTTPQLAWLNVFVPGQQGAFGSSYLHSTSATNNNLSETRLSQTFLNSRRPDQAIVLASPVWQGGSENDRHTAMSYICDPDGSPAANCWVVTNLGMGENMPTEFGFHIYAQDRSPNAFVHQVEQSGSSSSSLHAHPILGNDPHRCARPIATPFLSPSAPANNAGFDFEHDQQRAWSLFSYGGNFPLGAEFFIFVDEREFEECVLGRQDSIFADRFQ